MSPGRTPVGDSEQNLAGGLNTVSAPDALAENQFRRGDNGRLTPYGAFIKRGGTQRTSAAIVASTSVLNGTTWFLSDGTSIPCIILSDGSFAACLYGAFPIIWVTSVPGFFSSTTPSFAPFIRLTTTEQLYIADGGGLNRFDGSGLSLNIAGTPNVNVLAVHNERLWGCGDPSFPDSIFYSDLNNGDSLGVGASGGGQIIVRTYGNQNVVGLVSLGTSLMIFHTTGISRLTGYGQSDVTVVPAGITGDVGTTAPFSIVRVDNVVYFVSDRGLYAATEQNVIPIATPQQPDPLTLVLPTMASSDIANIRTTLNRGTREIYIYVPGYGLYTYHTVLKAWSGPWVDGYVTPATTCLFETVSADGYPIVLRGDSRSYVSECDRPGIFLDNVHADGTGGTTYSMVLQPRRFYCKDPNLAKAWRYVYVLADLNGSAACTVQWMTNSTTDSLPLPVSTGLAWGSPATMWGTGTWGSVSQTSYRLPMSGNGYYVDILITDSGETLPVFSQVSVQGFALGRR